ncbi:MAG: L,D-transpeptidase [Myxococcales bacterium]|nr:L,D-transpeptidase [Myxococcales bacterium]MDH5567553.1 L,D-transpeptidase [Myxococcales bacterium]
MRTHRSLTLLFLLPLLVAGMRERGVVLELDRAQFSLTARDLDAGVEGPTLRVALGSPAHPTPTGEYSAYSVVRNPAWTPGAFARAFGAEPLPPSQRGPLGAGKIPFAAGGAIALHGGAHPLLLGKPVSLGCVRALDADFLALLDWLEARGALRGEGRGQGELRQAFRRPVRIVVR